MSQSVLLAPPSSTGKMRLIPKAISKGTISNHAVFLEYRKLLVTYNRYTFYGKISKGYSNPLVELIRLGKLNRNILATRYPEHIIKSSHKSDDNFITQLPVNIQPTFKELGLSDTEASQFLATINKFHHYLKHRNVNYVLETDYTTDPEYPDWTQLLITIRIRSNFNAVYSKVKSKIYGILGRTVSDNLYQKLIIKIQSH